MVDQRVPFTLSQQVTFDASGNGNVRFQPLGEEWEIEYLSVSATYPTSGLTRQGSGFTYVGQIGAQYKIDETVNPSTGDTSDTRIWLQDGESLYFEWQDASPNQVGTAVIRGYKTVVRRGFRTKV